MVALSSLSQLDSEQLVGATEAESTSTRRSARKVHKNVRPLASRRSWGLLSFVFSTRVVISPCSMGTFRCADQKERAKWLKALRAATAAATRRARAASGDGDAPEEEPPAESAFSSALRYIGFAK